MRTMKRLLGVCIPLAALTLLVSPSIAAVVNPIVDFGTGYCIEQDRVAGDHTADAGYVLTIVGHVVDFNAPFDDLDPNDPTKEYTYVYRGMTSTATVVSGAGSFLFYDTDYLDGGTLEIHADDTPDADWAVPSTFVDGDMILLADVTNFHTSTKSFNCAGSQNADIVFSGGSLFSRVSTAGVGWDGITTGLFSVCPSLIPDDIEGFGYFGLSDTKIDVIPPTAAQRETWGGIKRLYRD